MMLALILLILGLVCLLAAALNFAHPRLSALQLMAAGLFLLALSWTVRIYSL